MTTSSSALDPSVCPACENPNAPGARFCSQCGAPILAVQSPAELTSVLALDTEFDPMESHGGSGSWERGEVAELLVLSGPLASARFALEGDPVTVGRAEQSTIFLDDFTVSRRHAEITPAPGGTYLIRDLGSLNGTYVNRERVEESVLADCDQVQIGRFPLLFHAAKPKFAAVVRGQD